MPHQPAVVFNLHNTVNLMTHDTPSLAPAGNNTLDRLDPESLERGLYCLVRNYQATRSAMIAWFVVRYAQALCQHPDFEGSSEQRCAWRRLAAQWQWLAQTADTTGSNRRLMA